MVANEGGRLDSRAARFAAPVFVVIVSNDNISQARPNLHRGGDIRSGPFIRTFAFSGFGTTPIH
jgi:hypothetical protein